MYLSYCEWYMMVHGGLCCVVRILRLSEKHAMYLKLLRMVHGHAVYLSYCEWYMAFMIGLKNYMDL